MDLTLSPGPFLLRVHGTLTDVPLVNAKLIVPHDVNESCTLSFDWKKTLTLLMIEERDGQLSRGRGVSNETPSLMVTD